jgi:hypothetical protein
MPVPETVIITVSNTGNIPFIGRTGPITRGIPCSITIARALKNLGYRVNFIDPVATVAPQPVIVTAPVFPPLPVTKPVVIAELEPLVPEEIIEEETAPVTETVIAKEEVVEVIEEEKEVEDVVVDLAKMDKDELLALAKECNVSVPNPKKIKIEDLRKLLETALDEE